MKTDKSEYMAPMSGSYSIEGSVLQVNDIHYKTIPKVHGLSTSKHWEWVEIINNSDTKHCNEEAEILERKE